MINMEDFIYRGKNVEFWLLSGEIIGNQKHSETHVSSSGGAGGAPVKVHSNVVTTHEFWIKAKDGKETAVTLKNTNVPLRVGQIISILCTRRSGAENGEYGVLVNYNTNDYHFINDAAGLVETLKLETITGKSIIFTIIIFLTVGYCGKLISTEGMWGLGLIVAIMYFVYRIIKKMNQIDKVAKGLKAHMGNLASKILAE